MTENERRARIADLADRIIASHFTEDAVKKRAEEAGLNDPQEAARQAVYVLSEVRAFTEELVAQTLSDKEILPDESSFQSSHQKPVPRV